MNLSDKLDFYIKNNLNVLLTGRHGCGKSSLIIDAVERANLKYRYFSASTMDPWVDFLGIPKEVKGENGSYLDLIRPKDFQEDNVEIIIFDEFNRAPKKIRNAAMEIIQFKSINGRKFNNLRMIWAAINPDDDFDYDVEKLDLAQKDRFHIHLEIPYELDVQYFSKKYDEETAKLVNEWWNELSDNVKIKVSPRRVDYALEIFLKNGSLRDVLPPESNVSKLTDILSNGSYVEKIKKVFNKEDEAKIFLSKENNYSACINFICASSKYSKFFLPLLSDEKKSLLITGGNKEIIKLIAKEPEKYSSILLSLNRTSNISKIRELTIPLIKSKIIEGSFSPDVWYVDIFNMNALEPWKTYSAKERNTSFLVLKNNIPKNPTEQEFLSICAKVKLLVYNSSRQHLVKMLELGKILNHLFVISCKNNWPWIDFSSRKLNDLRKTFQEIVF